MSQLKPPAFFEGPEKKVELTVVDDHPSLRRLGEAFWHRVVNASGAEVVSKRSNDVFDAYLLSESSLFVYESFVTMITCGRTQLVRGVDVMLEAIPDEAIAVLIYERKNEHFPHEQASSFFEDARHLAERLDGRALRSGVEHEHAVRLFHTTRGYQPVQEDRTLEVLMHGIDERCAETFLASRRPPSGTLAQQLGLRRALEGFEVDEFVFDPAGYSLNGMRDEAYVTLHVTPERVGSYVSFETNAPELDHDPSGLVQEVVERFRPESFDVVVFEPDDDPVSVDVPGYVLRKHVQEPVSGYHVTFQHFYRPSTRPVRAFSIPLSS